VSKNGQSPRVTILLENHSYPHDVRVQPHAEALADIGYQTVVICPRGKGHSWRETINRVRAYRFPMPAGGKTPLSYLAEFCVATAFMTVLTLWVWICHGMDLLLMYNPPDSLFVAGLLPKLAGKTIVYDLRDLSPELYESKFEHTNNGLHRLLLWLEGCSCRLADHVVVVNESYRQMVIQRDGIPPERVTVIRQGPNLNNIRLTAPDPNLRVRAKTIIAYLGSMAKGRGAEYLLGALPHLEKRFGHSDWFCVLVGREDASQDLGNLATELGIGDRTWFTGFLPLEQWVPLLSTADVCVDPGPANPVNNLSTTNKMMDYMALGKPMVVFDLPERRITAGESALYARPNEVADLARQLARLIEEPELRTRLGTTGRERVEHHLAWEHQKRRLLTLYNELTEKHLTVVPQEKVL